MDDLENQDFIDAYDDDDDVEEQDEDGEGDEGEEDEGDEGEEDEDEDEDDDMDIDDDDDDDDDDDGISRKKSRKMENKYLKYKLIGFKSEVIDTEDIIQPKLDNKSQTLNYLTRFEYSKIIGLRAQQIAENAPPFIKIGDEKDPIKVAEMELKQGKLPYVIHRPIFRDTNGKIVYEVKTLSELYIPSY